MLYILRLGLANELLFFISLNNLVLGRIPTCPILPYPYLEMPRYKLAIRIYSFMYSPDGHIFLYSQFHVYFFKIGYIVVGNPATKIMINFINPECWISTDILDGFGGPTIISQIVIISSQ